jgi:hypothetical protein
LRARSARRVSLIYWREDFTRDGQRYNLILASNAYLSLSDYRN